MNEQFLELFQCIANKAVESVQPEAMVLVCCVDALARDPLGGFNLTSVQHWFCVEAVLALKMPLLLLGVGGNSGADATKTFAAIVSTVLGQRENRPDDIPEHDFYEEYLPNVQIATAPVPHRPNLNSAENLRETGDRSVATLEEAALIHNAGKSS